MEMMLSKSSGESNACHATTCGSTFACPRCRIQSACASLSVQPDGALRSGLGYAKQGAPPTAADIQHASGAVSPARLDVPVHLAALGRVEIIGRHIVEPQGGRVAHRRPEKPSVKVVADVIVILDRFFRCAHVVVGACRYLVGHLLSPTEVPCISRPCLVPCLLRRRFGWRLLSAIVRVGAATCSRWLPLHNLLQQIYEAQSSTNCQPFHEGTLSQVEMIVRFSCGRLSVSAIGQVVKNWLLTQDQAD